MRPDEVMEAIHAHLPKLHDPYSDLVPPQGIRLTPKHYAYVKFPRAVTIVVPFVSSQHARRSGEPAGG